VPSKGVVRPTPGISPHEKPSPGVTKRKEAVSIITDRDTGRSKGFGFVTMSEEGCGQSDRAIEWVAA